MTWADDFASCGHQRSAIVASFCEHPGCRNARKRTHAGQPLPEPPPRFQPGPARKRTGHDTLRDLADAPGRLRAMADAAAPGTFDPAALHRWADAVDEILDFPPSRAWVLLAAFGATGMLAGAVLVMVLSR